MISVFHRSNNLLYLFFVCAFSFSFSLSAMAEDLHLKCSGTGSTIPGDTKYSSDYLVNTVEQTIQGMEVDREGNFLYPFQMPIVGGGHKPLPAEKYRLQDNGRYWVWLSSRFPEQFRFSVTVWVFDRSDFKLTGLTLANDLSTTPLWNGDCWFIKKGN